MRLLIIVKLFFISFVGVVFYAESSFAQQATQPANLAVTSSSSTSQPAVNTLTQDGLVSLDFQDANIKNVLKVLAYKSNMNIVAGPEVTGNVTIQLNNVPWQKALEVILTTYGYSYEKRGNIITVTTIENLKKRRDEALSLAEQEPLATKSYLLSFAKASDVIDSLSKMKTSRGQINFDQRTNSIIIRDVQSNLELIDTVMKTLDSPTPQVLIEAKILETDFSDTENLGIDWTISLGAAGSATPTTFPFQDRSNNVFLNSQPFSKDPTATDFKYGTLNASGLSAALEVLSRKTNTNVLSNPHIMTLDNQPAKILVGLKYPIAHYQYNQEQGKLQIDGVDFLEIGVTFLVTPHVNNANLVTLDVNPSITAIKDQIKIDPASTATVPELTTEEAKTKVMIRNGETLVIAGLIAEKKDISNSKVPFLGDVPMLGRLFKKDNDARTKQEIIIFLTPHIITSHSMETSQPANPS